MILADTSVWIDHFNRSDTLFAGLLAANSIVMHPYVMGEIALGHLRQRNLILETLGGLPQARVASPAEVLHFIEENKLDGVGIGYVDAHLLASARLTPGTFLWTHDKRLHAAAEAVGLAKHQLHS